MTYEHRLTQGYIARHRPPRSNLDLGIALLDIAQDFILAHLFAEGIFDLVVFKGGTALRKLWAGTAGRFSTDLDFALTRVDDDRAEVGELIARTLGGETLGPFRIEAAERRGRWSLRVGSDFGDAPVSLKIDVGPPPWLEPELRSPVEAPIHDQYDFELPSLPVVRLEETLAEKISRLNRGSTARDAWDLVWSAQQPGIEISDSALRRLAVLKMWADANGLGGAWTVGQGSGPFLPEVWLAERSNWDDESIGLLCEPPPSLTQLGDDLCDRYRWLADLTPDEERWARAREEDRAAVVTAILDHPGCSLDEAQLWSF